jgi:hypothetical protein
MDLYQTDVQCGKGSIGFGLHTVGNDNDVETVDGVLQIEARMYALVYDGVFTISRDKDGKTLMFLCRL